MEIRVDDELFYTSEKHTNAKKVDINHHFVINEDKKISKDTKIRFQLWDEDVTKADVMLD